MQIPKFGLPWLPKEEFFKILLSFISIVIVGFALNRFYQSKTWIRQIRFELFKNELVNNSNTLSELTELVEQRLFASQQFIWSIEDGRENAIEDTWKAYMATVHNWNLNDQLIQNKVANMSGWEVASQILTYVDDLNNKIPTSIHYKFFRIHEYLLLVRECYYAGCGFEKDIDEVKKLLEALIDQETKLLGDLNGALTERYTELKRHPSNFLDGEY